MLQRHNRIGFKSRIMEFQGNGSKTDSSNSGYLEVLEGSTASTPVMLIAGIHNLDVLIPQSARSVPFSTRIQGGRLRRRTKCKTQA
jgi:hypothetical protein